MAAICWSSAHRRVCLSLGGNKPSRHSKLMNQRREDRPFLPNYRTSKSFNKRRLWPRHPPSPSASQTVSQMAEMAAVLAHFNRKQNLSQSSKPVKHRLCHRPRTEGQAPGPCPTSRRNARRTTSSTLTNRVKKFILS